MPCTGATFIWDSAYDQVGMAGSQIVQLRVSLSDGAMTGDCGVQIDVLNQVCPLCGDCDSNGVAPVTVDALRAAQADVGLVTLSTQETACCDVDSSGAVTVLDALNIARAAVALPVTLTCP
jgi:hypothetical protein